MHDRGKIYERHSELVRVGARPPASDHLTVSIELIRRSFKYLLRCCRKYRKSKAPRHVRRARRAARKARKEARQTERKAKIQARIAEREARKDTETVDEAKIYMQFLN